MYVRLMEVRKLHLVADDLWKRVRLGHTHNTHTHTRFNSLPEETLLLHHDAQSGDLPFGAARAADGGVGRR